MLGKIIIDKGKFVGRIKIRDDGKVQVVTTLSDGNEAIKWSTWEEIKQAVEEMLQEQKEESEL